MTPTEKTTSFVIIIHSKYDTFSQLVCLEARRSHKDGKTSVYAWSHTLQITYFGRHLMMCIKNINLNYFHARIGKTGIATLSYIIYN